MIGKYLLLVQGIAGDPSALGFFGIAYYEENQGRLKLQRRHSAKRAETFEECATNSMRPLAETGGG